MKLLVIHLSDLHHSELSPIDPQRFRKLASPIPALLHERPDLVAFLIGGDLVNRGEAKSFTLISNLLDQAKQSILQNFPDTPLLVAAVPGNHDNDFTIDQSARDAILASFDSQKPPGFNGTLADTLLATQSQFFEIEQKLTTEHPAIPLAPTVDRRIAWRHEHEAFPDVGVTCLNSALLSHRHEEPGKLFLPEDIELGNRSIELVLVHHPLNWLEAWHAKEIRKKIHSSKRIFLTGHEHLGNILESNLSGAGTVLVVEAPLFSGKETEKQGFTTVYFDTTDSTHQEYQFFWENDCYQAYCGDLRVEPGQALLPLATLKDSVTPSSNWKFEPKFETYLDSTELLFSKEGTDHVKLKDIFEFPDIRELTHQSEYQKSRMISGERLCDEVRERPMIFVLGPNHCGKSALAKTLMKVFLADGKVPLLSQGQRMPADTNRYRAHLNELCSEQYGQKQVGLYTNLPLQDKILLIDNYQDAPKKAKLEHRVLKMVNQHCSQVIVFCEETDLGPLDLANFAVESNLKITVMNIQPLGVPGQRQLIERWLAMDADLLADKARFAQREHEAIKLIGGIIGKGFVQPFPPYILAILQSIDAGQPVDVTASTHGHLYEAFIKAALAKRRSMTNHNILMSFASYMAFRMFKENLEDCSADYLRELHTQWEEMTDLNRSLKSLLDDLTDVRFLHHSDGTYRFGEKFVSYYFTAFFIKDHLTDPTVRAVVTECVQKVWVDDYANVLLFLAHLSRDGNLVDELIQEADSYFADKEPAELRGFIQFGEHQTIESTNEPDLDGAQERKEELETVAYEQGLQEMPIRLDRSSNREDLDYLAKLCAAVKVLQILGQFVKNFPANFSPAKKQQIVERSIAIGLRTLGSTFELISESQAEIIKELADLLTRKGDVQRREAEQEASIALANLTLITSFGLIKRISNAIGSRELGKTYERVFNSAPDAPSWKLIDMSLKLDHIGNFPDEKVKRLYLDLDKADDFAQRLLKQLVARHFRLFEVPYKVRQSICAFIKIPFRSYSLNNRERLIGKPKT